MPELHRVAVVNRGEAAMRAVRGIAEHNHRHGTALTSIALPTDADASAWFARAADEVVPLGPAFHTTADGQRRLAYLDHDLVMDALRRARADAVWVGWGFVAEDADFAQLCEEAGITFIGPSSAVIRRLGDKIAAKTLAESVDVPVAPWSGGPVASAEEAATAAEAIGYPLMVKAAAGGGGRGIRKVTDPAGLAAAVASAQAEARLAFRDDRVFMERALEAARHLEVQVIADTHGTTWAIGVRDCSVQRRNQKVIEESASPDLLDPAVEQHLRDAAVRLCAQAGYSGAGTVEFLHDPATGTSAFMEVNTRLQVEHPVTELVTGADLVDLQLQVARGLPLEGEPPPSTGHAIEVRLNAEDPMRDFAPSPGRIALLRVPGGPGVRVDAGVSEGDVIASEFDSMIAKLLTVGRDRTEAMARMRRALREAVVVVRGGTTNKAFLQSLLGDPDIVQGGVTTRWLDRRGPSGPRTPAQDRAEQLGLVAAAVEIADLEHAARQEAFLAAARRGRPEVDPADGVAVSVRSGGVPHELTVHRTGATTYRLIHPDGLLECAVDRLGTYERRLHLAGSTHKVVIDAEGPTVLVEVDGTPLRVERDDGGAVRSPAPAAVIRHLTEVGEEVAEGTPLVVIESMKMETTIAAPFAGRVRELTAPLNTQVDAGATLVVLEPAGDEDAAASETPERDTSQALRLPVTAEVDADARARCDLLFDSLRSWLLGYDLDAGRVSALGAERALICEGLPDDHLGLAAHEEEVLEIFGDLEALSRPTPLVEDVGEGVAMSPKEHLATYLQAIDRGAEVVPGVFLDRLQQALAHHGVDSLDRTPELEAALHRMFRGFLRLDSIAPLIAGILQRRLDADRPPPAGPDLRGLLEGLGTAAEGRHPTVGDLARSLRFHRFDEPLVEASRDELHAQMDHVLDRLAAHPDHPDRDELISKLVECPQPLRPLLLRRASADDVAQRRIALEVRALRYYRIRDLETIQHHQLDGHLIATTRYPHEGTWVHLVLAYTDEAGLDDLLPLLAQHTAPLPDETWSVIDVMVERRGPAPTVDSLAEDMARRLAGTPFQTRVHRFDTMVTAREADADTPKGPAQRAARTRHVTHRQAEDGSWAEDGLYRNLHPMLAKRVGLWRLSNFDVRRLPSAEDVYAFHGVARDNPADERIFAIAEVRDLTPARDADGDVVGLPELERMLAQSLSVIRLEQSRRPPGGRLLHNRVILYVRPPLDVPQELWRQLAHRLAPATAGLGLQKVVLVAQIPNPSTGELQPAVLHLHHVSRHGVVVRQDTPSERPIRTLSAYELRVLKTERRGSAYPYEILRMLTPSDDVASDFPPGTFTELDLDEDGELIEVDRPWGGNTANVVIGVLSNRTAKVPEGMRRAVILGDPSRSLGSLAEAECRRINAAIALAAREQIPVEWYAVSSGARISMESGTENMDWIGAVLRELIEFTQDGGEVNIVVTGINVGAQPYWNAEATMLMHTRGILVMTPASAMVLTGKQALDFSGGVSAEDNFGIGGYDRVMGPNGQGQHWAPTLEEACALLLRHYDHTYVVPGERFPRRAQSTDSVDRDVRDHPHAETTGSSFATVGEVLSDEANPGRKLPFDMRSVMRAVSDADQEPLERWGAWLDADTAVVWDAHVGGHAVCMVGIESHTVPRRHLAPADGPPAWTSGTLFPQSSRKIARALNAASGNRPVVVLANLSGFDGSPESLRQWQLEYGAEIGRAVTNFRGPIVFVVVSRYHGGAFVVFSKRLNPSLEIAAVEGSRASVIGGTPAAAVVFTREVAIRTDADPRLAKLRDAAQEASGADRARMLADLDAARRTVRAEKIGEVAEEFDGIHDIARAQRVGSVDHIIPAAGLRPYIVDALARGMATEVTPPAR